MKLNYKIILVLKKVFLNEQKISSYTGWYFNIGTNNRDMSNSFYIIEQGLASLSNFRNIDSFYLLALFYSLTVEINDGILKIKFGMGLIRKKIDLTLKA